MGVAARTTTALYCACAAVLVASRPTVPRARAHGPTPLAARSLNLEGGARGEADRDAVETENRERLSVSSVKNDRTLLRRRPTPPAARAGSSLSTGSTTREAAERAREGRDGTSRPSPQNR